MAKSPKAWAYGKSPNPTNWHEAAEALKSQPRKPKANPLMARLDAIESLLKEKK